jgi:hypothetical protein
VTDLVTGQSVGDGAFFDIEAGPMSLNSFLVK